MFSRIFCDATDDEEFPQMFAIVVHDPCASDEDKEACPALERLVEVLAESVDEGTAQRVRSHVVGCHACSANLLSLIGKSNQECDA